MQRYFIAQEQIVETSIRLVGDDVHHIKNVMRNKPGDRIICCAGQGLDYLAEIESIDGDQIIARIVERTPSRGEPRTKVLIAQSLPKGDKLEWILQKGTELGASAFLPFSSERSIVKIDARKIGKKRERWERIVKEAAEQAHRGKLPTVATPMSWKALLQEIGKRECAWIAYEKGGLPLAEAMASAKDEILLIVGPEGGFTESEIEEAREAGAVPISLGSRILRTETAPLMALSCILFARQDLGGE
ncbi:16S rRNA (uracil(1498)-N(3))-methyltransferase [Laceyella sacchari]|uniref:Ribosomal RNA small subunit methyltransferase E n=1 Tax=Laceyella tengchongensis TaxID=574699 RepID=A0AA46AEI1_9BACL|nr:16S rRNA (uracil(1498)-N(3))-methyltransferase [Laceyella tengchongensis]AUS09474.1 16S rRNA (uracil(1498)-N(3))-methyltransferase [Laceyella sacchari]MRG29443.1 16S rRNA (uracil(1498)-N(3))-methyltransferase [Laceyella tengchongensis]SMP12634.1 16S rRNA (uracil1498-N3)-methyltransferase [Laceyella tengchongensis]